MKQTTKLNMASVRDEVQRQLAEARRQGVSLYYVKDGQMIEELPQGASARPAASGKRAKLESV
jgi:hypothetical protein